MTERIYDQFEDLYRGAVALQYTHIARKDCIKLSAAGFRGMGNAFLTQSMALRVRDAINVFLRETDYEGSEEDEQSPFVTQREEDYHRDLKERNDCRLALAAFMAAYGNCDIPGAALDLAHKPQTEVDGHLLTPHDACEVAMLKAWVRGCQALGIRIEPQRRRE